MPSRQREYFTIVRTLWGNQISGPILAVVTIVLPIVALFITDTKNLAKFMNWSAVGTGGVAVMLIIVAQYKAWALERDSVEAEQGKNLKPDIQGEFSDVVVGQFPYVDQSKPGTIVSLLVWACNQREAETSIKEIAVSVDGFNGVKYTLVDTRFWVDATPDTLRRGVHQRVRVQGSLYDTGFKNIDPATITIRLIDGFGNEHPILPRSA